jgi:hypothetical protein
LVQADGVCDVCGEAIRENINALARYISDCRPYLLFPQYYGSPPVNSAEKSRWIEDNIKLLIRNTAYGLHAFLLGKFQRDTGLSISTIEPTVSPEELLRMVENGPINRVAQQRRTSRPRSTPTNTTPSAINEAYISANITIPDNNEF